VWTGAQAKGIGLVDQLGNLYDAIDLAAKEAGVKGKAQPRFMGQARGLADLLRGASRLPVPARLPGPVPATGSYPLWLYQGPVPGGPPGAGRP
jgi:protease-4